MIRAQFNLCGKLDESGTFTRVWDSISKIVLRTKALEAQKHWMVKEMKANTDSKMNTEKVNK